MSSAAWAGGANEATLVNDLDRIAIEPKPSAGKLRHRKMCRSTMYVLAWLGFVLCPAALALLVLSLIAAWQQYGQGVAVPLLFLPDSLDWLRITAQLDMTGFAWLIVLIFGWRLWHGGWRSAVTIPRQENSKFWTHAYPETLWPDGMEKSVLRLGFIGLLASLLLVAVAMKDSVPDMASGSAVQIFHQYLWMIFAAMLSSFAGVAVAWLLPVIEPIHAGALGQDQLSIVDPNVEVDRFIERLRGITSVMGEFQAQANAMGEVTRQMLGVIAPVRELVAQIAAATKGLPDVVVELRTTLTAVGAAQPHLTEAAAGMTKAGNALVRVADSSTARQSVLMEFGAQLKGMVEKLKPLVEKLLKSTASLHGVAATSADTHGVFVAQTQKTATAIDSVRESLETIAGSMNEQSKTSAAKDAQAAKILGEVEQRLGDFQTLAEGLVQLDGLAAKVSMLEALATKQDAERQALATSVAKLRKACCSGAPSTGGLFARLAEWFVSHFRR